MNTLYIIATPIGNLKDISLRALEALKEVDLILCEDTRETRKLLDYYNIRKPTLSYHEHSKLKKVEYIINILKEGKKLALVSDAGTPGVSDPGGKLVEKVIESLNGQVRIVPIPGTSALIAAASVSSFPMNRFVFLGFPPVKKKRNNFFEEIISSKLPVIFYESPYRILKTLNELKIKVAEVDPYLSPRLRSANKELRVMVCRELTKKFETIYRGTIEEVIKQIEKDIIKGEFVVIIGRC